MLSLDAIYEKFKKFCTEWDEPDYSFMNNKKKEDLPVEPLVIPDVKKKSYFTIEEMCASDTARARGIDNTPSFSEKRNLQLLIDNVLDPLREAFGEPVMVTSGFRCRTLNTAVGGASNSQHMRGQAADISHPYDKRKNKQIFDIIVSMGVYDQVIIEKGTMNAPQWIHVSFNEFGNRKQRLLTSDGKTYRNI